MLPFKTDDDHLFARARLLNELADILANEKRTTLASVARNGAKTLVAIALDRKDGSVPSSYYEAPNGPL